VFWIANYIFLLLLLSEERGMLTDHAKENMSVLRFCHGKRETGMYRGKTGKITPVEALEGV